MDVLNDSSNIRSVLSDRSVKRPRLSQLEPTATTFTQIVDRAGISAISADGISVGGSSASHPGVDDPRRVKRQLTDDLAKAAAQDTFLASMSSVMADDELLRRCLLPLEVTNERCLKYATGDSFMRLLLNILPLQQRLATMLLQKLPEFSTAECDEPDGAAADSKTASLSSLILAQLRWLEVVADSAALTTTMLEVLPVCSPSIQRQLIGILPEVAAPQDHGVVLEQLQSLLEADVTFMAPVVECLGNMMLDTAVQAEVVSSLLAQLPAVEVEDLPGLTKYLVGAAASSNAEQVLTSLRSNLHFINPADPRLAVPDRRQKGLLHPGSKSPEALLVRELVAALQANPAAATSCLKLQAALTDPGAHGCFDLVVLLALHAKGADSKRAVEACLKKKLTEGAATPAWLTRALTGHQACYRDQLWNSLLSLASTWCGARDAPVSAAAAALYVSLFVVFEASLERQQVLHALHGHLGSGVAGQQDVALQALGTLASRHVGLLRGYSSYLANVLDHLEGFSNKQLQQVFNMFAALTAREPAASAAAAAAAAGAGSSSSAAAGGSSAAAAGGSRLEDELVITLNKALAQSNPGYKRIGIMGMLALLQQEGATYELRCDADGSAADGVRDSWISRAESLFIQCISHPGVFAFLLDQWSHMLEAHQQHSPAAAAGAAAQAGGDAGGPSAPVLIPAPMLDWMHEKVNDLLVEVFTAEMPGGVPEASEVQATLAATQAHELNLPLDDTNIKAQLWFNLDGSFAPVYLAILPLVASNDVHKRAQLAWLPAALRLLAAIANCRFGGDMTNIDALLGCPLALPDRNMFADGQWDSLPLPSRVSVLLALQHTICWLREVVAVFAPCISTEALVATVGSDNTQATMDNLAATQNKLIMRLAQLRATEALFCDLAATCPAAAQQLPDLSYPLTTAAAFASRGGFSSSHQAGGGASGGSKSQAGSAPAALALCRCLRPPAAIALNTCQPPHLLHTVLLPATHLANDLHSKLKLLLKRTRTPAGLMLPPAAPSGVGVSAGGVFPAVLAPSGPPCLEGVELQHFVCQVVVPLLPALQQHMAMALNMIKQPPQGDVDILFEGLPGYNSPGEAAMFELQAVQAVVQPTPAAHSLALCCLQCFTLLLGCGKELPLQVLQAVLAALALQPAQPAAAEPLHKQQVCQSLIAAFKACRKLSCRSSGNSSLQLELSLLSLLQGLRGLGADQGLSADKVTAMSGKLSKAAAELLQETWQGPEDEAAEGDKGFSWKGQTAAISQLLGVLISQSADPTQELLSLVTDALSAMPDKMPSKEQLDPVAGFAALCSATFATWYKVVFEQLQAHWERLNSRAISLLPSAAGQGGAGAGRKKQQLQLNSQGQPEWDAEQVDELVQQAHRCAQSFAGLVELTRKHKTRIQLLGTALKNGGGFVDVMVKSTQFWFAFFIVYGKPFQQLVKTVQKGTKVMQAICAEGKVRGGASVVAQAPNAKRALERFVHEMHSLFLRAGEPPEAITVGFLKHRDIEGNAMPSQLFPEPDEDDEDEDEGLGADDDEAAYEEEGSVAGE